MTLDESAVQSIVLFLRLDWSPEAIALRQRVSVPTVYRIKASLNSYGAPRHLSPIKRGRPRRLTDAAVDDLLFWLENKRPWAYQWEMQWFLQEECCVEEVSRSTVCRTLKRRGWSNKKGERIGTARSQLLREAYRVDISQYTAEQLVFVDESSFNETTGWRRMAWAPIGAPARYEDSRTRGKSWSVAPAYTVDGYLPCTAIRLGYFSQEAFFQWVANELLPQCNAYPAPRSVIVLDNVSSHIEQRLKDEIEGRGCRIKFLPPYSPDYNPIELTFAVLKAWIKRNFWREWPVFVGDFGAFLRYAVRQSDCDGFARQHFRHCAGGGYIFEGDMAAMERLLAEL